MPTLDEVDELKIQNEQKSHGEKVADSSNESAANTSTWTQESLARLVGFEEGDDVQNSTNTHQIAEAADSSTKSDTGNILTDIELFGTLPDDSTPQPRPLSSNPWSKFALVGSGLLAAFLLAGLILSQITGSKSGKTKPKSASPTPSPTPSVVADKENTEGRLKTELALQKQADKLQKVDEATRQKNQESKNKNKERPGQDQSKEPQPTRVRASHAPAPAPEPPSYQTTPRTWSSSPRRIPQPNVATSPPPTSVPASTPALTPPKNPLHQIAETPLKSTASPSIDPEKQWQTLARLGSYGQVQMVESEPTVEGNKKKTDLSSHLENRATTSTLASRNLSKATPTTPTTSTTSTIFPASSTSAASISDEETIREAESRVLEAVPIRLATVGTATSGVLTTPVIWSGDAKETGQNRLSSTNKAPSEGNGNQDFDQRFVVTLDQPLLDSKGQEVIGAGAHLIFSVVGVENNGLVQASAISLVEGDKEYSLPPNAFSIRGADGKPLLAKGYFDHGGKIASMDASTAALGMFAKVGEILNSPKQETNQSVSDGTTSTTTSSTTRSPNILGAVMEGGAKPLLEQIMQRNQRAIEQMDQTKNLWYMNAGKPVQVFINQSFKL